MPIRLSYINARGQEAILDDDEGTFAHELAGREGFEFPGLKLTDRDYGDGSSEVVAITLKERSVTCFFWADPPDIPHWEEKFDEVKSILLQTGQREGSWGKLRIRVDDKHYVYLNCVYEKGLDDIVRDINTRVKFSLTFRASDPYFYNGFNYSYYIQQVSGYLYFNNARIESEIAQAQKIANNDENLYFALEGNPTKYYVIYPYDLSHIDIPDDVPRTTYMESAELCTKERAIALTGNSKPRIDLEHDANNKQEDPKSNWWQVIVETTQICNTIGAVKTFLGNDSPVEGTDYWKYEQVNGAWTYKARKSEIQNYALCMKGKMVYLFSASGTTIRDLYIQCEKVYPEITINGPAENIIIANETIGRKIELDPSILLDTNDQIKIITTPMKRKITQIFKSGKTKNLIPWLSADSTLDWWLAHGSNNVSFNNSNTTPESYAKFDYMERRHGIQ